MKGREPQTAIQGVAGATVLNLFSRLLSYLRQVLITAFIGLSARLDAFYVATSVVALFINAMGDVFDAAGIPALVRARERRGEEAFRALAGAIFAFTLRMTALLVLAMVLCAPLAPALVPGIAPGSKVFIYENLALLVPYALAYLPFHCAGSFFRSARRFHVYYVAELLVQVAALGVLCSLRVTERAVPLSLSAGYLAGLALLLLWGRKSFRFGGTSREEGMGEVRQAVANMLPVYLVFYGLIVVDRYFASFLEVGAISALFYGYVLATAVPAIMNVENVFVTPLAEDSDRGLLLTHILSGICVVCAPVAAFGAVHALGLVRAVFERGAFTPGASAMTADAMKYYLVGLPALFAWPVCYRTLQIHRRFRPILAIAVATVTLNALLNYLLVLRAGMGVRGVALSMSLSLTFLSGAGLRLVSGLGIRVRYGRVLSILPGVAACAALGLGAAALLPPVGRPWADLLARGAVFTAVYTLSAFVVPGAEMARVREMVLESFPRLRRRAGRVS